MKRKGFSDILKNHLHLFLCFLVFQVKVTSQKYLKNTQIALHLNIGNYITIIKRCIGNFCIKKILIFRISLSLSPIVVAGIYGGSEGLH